MQRSKVWTKAILGIGAAAVLLIPAGGVFADSGRGDNNQARYGHNNSQQSIRYNGGQQRFDPNRDRNDRDRNDRDQRSNQYDGRNDRGRHIGQYDNRGRHIGRYDNRGRHNGQYNNRNDRFGRGDGDHDRDNRR